MDRKAKPTWGAQYLSEVQLSSLDFETWDQGCVDFQLIDLGNASRIFGLGLLVGIELFTTTWLEPHPSPRSSFVPSFRQPVHFAGRRGFRSICNVKIEICWRGEQHRVLSESLAR